ncbi:MAG: hypothetical protein A2V66_06530 [Ignavibacteria bacterium RBG_13_36_8]|nr:MAG: hypothetical protein A2V66_06530 [Ignavibacteria bacterium RBG_13_36_8]
MSSSSTKNPWLEIPASDYEAHMSSPQVGQLQMLNEIFKDTVNRLQPISLCVLGCTTGNGFEHIDWTKTKRLAAIDINQEYLNIAKERFYDDSVDIEFRCVDVNSSAIGKNEFDLVHAALFFEYVDVESVLIKIFNALVKEGILSVVLQQPDEEHSAVTKTEFTSLEKLAPIMKLVEKEEFKKAAERTGLLEIESSNLELKSIKKFYIGKFIKLSS